MAHLQMIVPARNLHLFFGFSIAMLNNHIVGVFNIGGIAYIPPLRSPHRRRRHGLEEWKNTGNTKSYPRPLAKLLQINEITKLYCHKITLLIFHFGFYAPTYTHIY